MVLLLFKEFLNDRNCVTLDYNINITENWVKQKKDVYRPLADHTCDGSNYASGVGGGTYPVPWINPPLRNTHLHKNTSPWKHPPCTMGSDNFWFNSIAFFVFCIRLVELDLVEFSKFK